jgi:methionyl-tRNA formyltransferase
VRLLFAGTPEAALPSLRALLGSPRHDVVAVLTRPDAPVGRGRRLERSPVAALAGEHGVEVLTPRRPSEPAFLDRLRELAVDCAPIVAYGALIPRAVLDIPPHGWINLHFSLLPAWRGASPVQAAIRHGDELTGASVFQLEEGLDTGPVYGVLTEPIRPTDTAGDVLHRLAEAGARLLVDVLDGIEDGTLRARPQPADGVTLAPKVTVDDARVDWAAPAQAVDRLIRSMTPEPGAWSEFRGERLKLWPVSIVDGEATLEPGQLHVEKHRVLVGAKSGSVLLGDVQPHGRKRMPASDWARGVRVTSGDRLE